MKQTGPVVQGQDVTGGVVLNTARLGQTGDTKAGWARGGSYHKDSVDQMEKRCDYGRCVDVDVDVGDYDTLDALTMISLPFARTDFRSGSRERGLRISVRGLGE